ncbi:hypothetical protein DH09_01320 (plasmid) [Bacillaceae bacterium JMAK1]|nr:hypothetical protein DH09_01320 [Bacillaceae bacterium JMAK1]
MRRIQVWQAEIQYKSTVLGSFSMRKEYIATKDRSLSEAESVAIHLGVKRAQEEKNEDFVQIENINYASGAYVDDEGAKGDE